MKKQLFVTAIILTLCIGTSLAQNIPTQNQHEKRVYIDDKGNYHIQKSLPVYLWFSTDPGESSKHYELKSKATADYANPMYLDTEGINYIRSKWAVNKENQKTVQPPQEILYEIYADGLAPKTSIKFSGAPKFVKGKVFYGKGLKVDLTSKDGVSGVENIHYSLNSGSYSTYSGQISIDEEKDHSFYYYSSDNVGNAENAGSRNFVVDLTAPSTRSSIEGIVHQGNILAPSTQLKLSSSDNSSGVRTTYYLFDSQGNKTYGNTITMAGLKDGNHTLYFYSIDNVKNEETRGSFAFYLDKIAPETNHQIIGDQHKGKYTYVSSRTTYNLSASDNKAGVKNIYYRIDGGERNTFSSNISLPNKLGTHNIKYDANDNVENLSGNTYINVFLDNEAPTTGIDYGQPQFMKQGNLYINAKTSIKLFKSDRHSGVQKTEYQVDGSGFKSYAQFNIDPEGEHTVTFKSTDNVNNVEQVKESKVHVDNTPPEIYANFSIEPVGKKSKGGNELNIYPNYTRLYLGATDEKVGTHQILYSLDGGPMTDYSSPQTLDISELNRFRQKKLYTVKVVAKDKLGNESEKTFEFYVGKPGE